MAPRRINIPIHGSATEDEARINWESSRKRGLPTALEHVKGSGRLAVAGSSPNVDIEGLRAWDGDIWAVNGTAAYLAKRGIKSTLLTIDPFNYDCADILPGIFGPIESAIVESCVNPLVFDALAGKDVCTLNVWPWLPDPINGGSTTATRAPFLALRVGYTEISFFGLEGSFEAGRSHVMKHALNSWHALTIEAGGERYLTGVEFMLQSDNLAKMIREFPAVFKDRSGGLLGAMIEHPDTWEVVEMTDRIRDSEIPEVAA